MANINSGIKFKIKLLSGQSCVMVEADGYETEIFIPSIYNNRIQLVNVVSSQRLSIITPLKLAESRLNALNENSTIEKVSCANKKTIRNKKLTPTIIENNNIKPNSNFGLSENISSSHPIANSTPELSRGKLNSLNPARHGVTKRGQLSTGYSTGYFTGQDSTNNSMPISNLRLTNNTSNYSNLESNNGSKSEECMLLTPELARRAMPIQRAFDSSIPQLCTSTAKDHLQNLVVSTKKIDTNRLSISPLQLPMYVHEKENLSANISLNIDNATINLPATPSFNEDTISSKNSTGNASFLNKVHVSTVSQWRKCLTPVRTYSRHGKFKLLTPKKELTPRLCNGELIPDYLRNPTKGIDIQNPIKFKFSKPKILIDKRITITDKKFEEQFSSTNDLERREFYFPRTKVELKRQRYTAFDLLTISHYNQCIASKLRTQFLKGCRKRTSTTNSKFESLINDIPPIINNLNPKKLDF